MDIQTVTIFIRAQSEVNSGVVPHSNDTVLIAGIHLLENPNICTQCAGSTVSSFVDSSVQLREGFRD